MYQSWVDDYSGLLFWVEVCYASVRDVGLLLGILLVVSGVKLLSRPWKFASVAYQVHV